MAYERKGRKEILLAAYFSGRSACSGFQYTRALGQEVSLEEAVARLWQFTDDNTQFFKY